MRIWFVAGEASGDSHGAHLIHALKRLAPEMQCEGLGGVEMEAAGMLLHQDLAREGIMGFVEVLKHAPRLKRLLRDTAEQIRATRPDAVVLIDYPGFNIRLARLLEGSGIPVIYYISPQVWAWKKGRLKTLVRICTRMLVIFPFEEKLYRDAGLDCVFVGHPLVEAVQRREEHARSSNEHAAAGAPGTCTIGLLPGSRTQEIARLFPDMVELARGLLAERPGLRFVAPCVNEARAAQIRALAGDFPVEVLVGGMHEVLSTARFCFVASGTATLETALFGVPMIVLYRVNPLTYAVARAVVDIQYIGMVNILAGRGVVPEFIQGAIRPAAILPVALDLIDDSPARTQMLADLRAVRESLGGGGASERAAREIIATIHTIRPAPGGASP